MAITPIEKFQLAHAEALGAFLGITEFLEKGYMTPEAFCKRAKELRIKWEEHKTELRKQI